MRWHLNTWCSRHSGKKDDSRPVIEKRCKAFVSSHCGGVKRSFSDHQYENHCKPNTTHNHKYKFWLEYNFSDMIKAII
ncbi:hypothetical protein ROHU_018770 [Labeo rohita]|uniref:Uncharacterized protein n=1 Tax=Labeo rohita TaxID=84645 RepID=A0A498N835_LABRO|nr:hypothetical protein ROHU_018770 [Labeo rohita]